jgi:hypothetical protein
VGVAGEEEVRAGMPARLTSGSDTVHLEDANSTRTRSRGKPHIGGSLEVREREREEEVKGVESPVKRVRSPIRALGQFGKGVTKGIIEGDDGKAPEKPELVAGKKRGFRETKTKGRSTYSAITSSEDEGTESEHGGSPKKKPRFAPVVDFSDEDETEDATEDETEDELGMCSV